MSDEQEWDGWDAKRRAILVSRADGGTIEEAAEAAGVGRTTVFRWRNENKDFAVAFERATALGTEQLEDVLHTCAKMAALDPKYQTSLIFSLKNRAPERWRDVQDLRHSGGVDLSSPADERVQRACAAILAKLGRPDDAGNGGNGGDGGGTGGPGAEGSAGEPDPAPRAG